ncbi:MAG: FAD binding domain-containing protein [Actinomycetota bacterium]
MKPPPFTYHRPRDRSEVDALLADLGGDARILAGGQSLVPILNMRLAAPEHLVDINHLHDEPTDPEEGSGSVAFGPLVRQCTAEESSLVAAHVPLLAEAIGHVAHPAIRSRGTVAGSIAHADPAAELPAALVALGGEVVARARSGSRTIPATEFFAGPLENSLEPGEWVVEIRWPSRAPGAGYAFEEFARRSGDYALCGVAAVVERANGSGFRATLSYLGMGDSPRHLKIDDFDLSGADDAVGSVSESLDPISDLHASREFRLRLARVLGARAVRRAAGATDEG